MSKRIDQIKNIPNDNNVDTKEENIDVEDLKKNTQTKSRKSFKKNQINQKKMRTRKTMDI